MHEIYVSETFKGLLDKHPLPWFAFSEGGDYSVGLPDTPPGIYDNNQELVFEITPEEPSEELVSEWDKISDNHEDYQYMSPRDAAFEDWYSQEGLHRMSKAEEIAEMFNKMFDGGNANFHIN